MNTIDSIIFDLGGVILNNPNGIPSDRKPNPSIFQQVIDEQNLDPSRTLFIDDIAEYIEGAKTIGLQTIHLTNGQTIQELKLV